MAVFCSSLTSCFPGMLLTYFLNDFETVPLAPAITRITFVFTFHMRCISVVRSLYFRIFSASYLITFLSPEIATSINIYVPFSLLLLLLLPIVTILRKKPSANFSTLRPPYLISKFRTVNGFLFREWFRTNGQYLGGDSVGHCVNKFHMSTCLIRNGYRS